MVGAFGVPHTPQFPAMVAEEGPGSEVGQLYRAVADEVKALDPDVLVVFSSDHLHTFFLDNLPTFCVGVAPETSGPNDGTPGLPAYTVEVDESLARHIQGFGLRESFDLSVTQEFTVDHTVLVPLHFLTPTMDTPILPIFVNGIVAPLPGARRCYALGQLVRAAVEAWPADVKVAVVASGGFSLDIGGHRAPEGKLAGVADARWSERMLHLLEQGETEDLLNEATSEQISRAGNVAGEMLNWISLLGAVGDRRPSMIQPQMEYGHAYGAWRWDQA